MHTLILEEIPLKKLKRNRRNARTHSARQITELAASIRAHGFCNPILVDEADVIIAGHGRLAAAHRLGLERVPVIRLQHLSHAQKHALAISKGKASKNSRCDVEQLAQESALLSNADVEFDGNA